MRECGRRGMKETADDGPRDTQGAHVSGQHHRLCVIDTLLNQWLTWQPPPAKGRSGTLCGSTSTYLARVLVIESVAPDSRVGKRLKDLNREAHRALRNNGHPYLVSPNKTGSAFQWIRPIGNANTRITCPNGSTCSHRPLGEPQFDPFFLSDDSTSTGATTQEMRGRFRAYDRFRNLRRQKTTAAKPMPAESKPSAAHIEGSGIDTVMNSCGRLVSPYGSTAPPDSGV